MNKELVDTIMSYVDKFVHEKGLLLSIYTRSYFIQTFHTGLVLRNGMPYNYNKEKYIDYNSFNFIIIETFMDRPNEISSIKRAKSYRNGQYYYILDNDLGNTSVKSRIHIINVRKILRDNFINELLK